MVVKAQAGYNTTGGAAPAAAAAVEADSSYVGGGSRGQHAAAAAELTNCRTPAHCLDTKSHVFKEPAVVECLHPKYI